MIGKILVAKFKDNQSLIVLGLAVTLVLMGCIFSLGSNCIHKYYLMKQYRPELFQK